MSRVFPANKTYLEKLQDTFSIRKKNIDQFSTV